MKQENIEKAIFESLYADCNSYKDNRNNVPIRGPIIKNRTQNEFGSINFKKKNPKNNIFGKFNNNDIHKVNSLHNSEKDEFKSELSNTQKDIEVGNNKQKSPNIQRKKHFKEYHSQNSVTNSEVSIKKEGLLQRNTLHKINTKESKISSNNKNLIKNGTNSFILEKTVELEANNPDKHFSVDFSGKKRFNKQSYSIQAEMKSSHKSLSGKVLYNKLKTVTQEQFYEDDKILDSLVASYKQNSFHNLTPMLPGITVPEENFVSNLGFPTPIIQRLSEKKIFEENFVKRDFLKMKRIYDSFSEDESNAFKKRNFTYIHPHSNFKFFWDFFTFIVTMYLIIYSPVEIIFYIGFSSNLNLIKEILIDGLFIVDVLLSLFLAYYDFEENLIISLDKIIKNSLCIDFFLDLFASVPFNSLIAIGAFSSFEPQPVDNRFNFNPHNNIIKESEVEYFTSPSIFSNLIYNNQDKEYLMFKLIRILKIFKVLNNNEFLRRIKNYFDDNASILNTHYKMEMYYVYFIFISHVLSCIFIFLGTISYPNWITAGHYENLTFMELYLNSLYFNHTTVFTVGYGDILSKNYHEKIYNIVLMIVGIMLYSFALTSISNIVKMNDEKRKIYDNKKKFLNNISEKYFINKKLYDKLSRHLFHEMKNATLPVLSFINEFPITLQNEMILNMHRNIINSFKFFKDCYDNELIIQAIVSLKPATSMKNEFLVKKGEIIEEVIFIKMGKLQVEILLPTIKFDTNIQSLNPKKKNGQKADDIKNTLLPSKQREESENDLKLKSEDGNHNNIDYSNKSNLCSNERDNMASSEDENDKNNNSQIVSISRHNTNNSNANLIDKAKLKNSFMNILNGNEKDKDLDDDPEYLNREFTKKSLVKISCRDNQKKSNENEKNVIDAQDTHHKSTRKISQEKMQSLIIDNEDHQKEKMENKLNFETIKILQLRRNEDFGVSLIIDNIKSPLNLRTESKTAELFLMNKIDLMTLFQTHPHILHKIYYSSKYNLLQAINIIQNIKRKKLKYHPIYSKKNYNKEDNYNVTDKNLNRINSNFSYNNPTSQYTSQNESPGKEHKGSLEVIQESTELNEYHNNSSRNLSENQQNCDGSSESSNDNASKYKENKMKSENKNSKNSVVKINLDTNSKWNHSLKDKNSKKTPKQTEILDKNPLFTKSNWNSTSSEYCQTNNEPENLKLTQDSKKKLHESFQNKFKNKFQETVRINKKINFSSKSNPHVTLSPKSNFINEHQWNKQNINYINFLKDKYTKLMNTKQPKLIKPKKHLSQFLKPNKLNNGNSGIYRYQVPVKSHKSKELINFDSVSYRADCNEKKLNRRNGKIRSNFILPSSVTPTSDSDIEQIKRSLRKNNLHSNNDNATSVDNAVTEDRASYLQQKLNQNTNISWSVANEHPDDEVFLKIKNNSIKNIFPTQHVENANDSSPIRQNPYYRNKNKSIFLPKLHLKRRMPKKIITKDPSLACTKRAFSASGNEIQKQNQNNVNPEYINIKTLNLSGNHNINIFVQLPNKPINQQLKSNKKLGINEVENSLINLNLSKYYNSDKNESTVSQKLNKKLVFFGTERRAAANQEQNYRQNNNTNRNYFTNDNNLDQNSEITICYKCKCKLTEKIEKIHKSFFDIYENKKYKITNESSLSILASTTDESAEEEEDNRQNKNITPFDIGKRKKNLKTCETTKKFKNSVKLGIEFKSNIKQIKNENNLESTKSIINKNFNFSKIIINKSFNNSEVDISTVTRQSNKNNPKSEVNPYYTNREMKSEILKSSKIAKKHKYLSYNIRSHEVSEKSSQCKSENAIDKYILNSPNQKSKVSSLNENDDFYNCNSFNHVANGNNNANINYNIEKNFSSSQKDKKAKKPNPKFQLNSQYQENKNGNFIEMNHPSRRSSVKKLLPLGNLKRENKFTSSNKLLANQDFFKNYELNMKNQLLSFSKNINTKTTGKSRVSQTKEITKTNSELDGNKKENLFSDANSNFKDHYFSSARSDKLDIDTSVDMRNNKEIEPILQINRQKSFQNFNPQNKQAHRSKENKNILTPKAVPEKKGKRKSYDYNMNNVKFKLKRNSQCYYNNTHKLEENLNKKLEKIMTMLKI